MCEHSLWMLDYIEYQRGVQFRLFEQLCHLCQHSRGWSKLQHAYQLHRKK